MSNLIGYRFVQFLGVNTQGFISPRGFSHVYKFPGSECFKGRTTGIKVVNKQWSLVQLWLCLDRVQTTKYIPEEYALYTAYNYSKIVSDGRWFWKMLAMSHATFDSSYENIARLLSDFRQMPHKRKQSCGCLVAFNISPTASSCVIVRS